MKAALLWAQKKSRCLKRRFGPAERDSDRDVVMENGSDEKSNSEKSEHDFSAFMLEANNDLEDE